MLKQKKVWIWEYPSGMTEEICHMCTTQLEKVIRDLEGIIEGTISIQADQYASADKWLAIMIQEWDRRAENIQQSKRVNSNVIYLEEYYAYEQNYLGTCS